MKMIISDIQSFKKNMKNMYHLEMSDTFIDCLNKQLTPLFKKQTGITPSHKIGLGLSFLAPSRHGLDKLYAKDVISGIVLDVYITAYTSEVLVLWESKSGRIYDINDRDIDCSDIQFRFHELQPLLYQKLLIKSKIPIVFENLSYELVLDQPSVDISVDMLLKDEDCNKIQAIASQIETFLRKFYTINQNGIKTHIHNFKYTFENNIISFQIDTGNIDIEFYKRFLTLLSDMNTFVRVNIS